MEFKDSKQILENMERLNYSIFQYKKTIDGMKQMCNRRIHRGYYNDCIVQYENIIDDKLLEIKECKKVLIDKTTFPIEMLIEFIKKCILIKENKNYVDTTVVWSQNVFFQEVYDFSYNVKYMIFDSYYEEEEKKIENAFFVRHMPASYIELLKNSKYIVGNYNKEIALLSENGLNSSFSSFPYLQEIAFNLVDRRLLEPDKDLQTILNEELESLKSVTLNKKNN